MDQQEIQSWIRKTFVDQYFMLNLQIQFHQNIFNVSYDKKFQRQPTINYCLRFSRNFNPAIPNKSFFNFEINDIDGNLVQLSKFQGKKAYICVNVACSCRLTTQNYVELVEMYKQYKDQGLEILGFPCNQFKNQESKPEPEIKNYVTQKYGAHFPLFQKIEVNGNRAHEIYQYLRYNSELRIKNKNEVKYVPWNFSKFLLDGNGNVINYYCPDVCPNEMIKDIESLLKN